MFCFEDTAVSARFQTGFVFSGFSVKVPEARFWKIGMDVFFL